MARVENVTIEYTMSLKYVREGKYVPHTFQCPKCKGYKNTEHPQDDLQAFAAAHVECYVESPEEGSDDR